MYIKTAGGLTQITHEAIKRIQSFKYLTHASFHEWLHSHDIDWRLTQHYA